jgi:hypothetical protein
MPTLCQTFRKEAGLVWNYMRKAAGLGLALSEETLTESALYNIAIAHQGTDIVIDLATKPAEAKHGADWEWWLVRGRKGLGFRVQAKRLFANGRYNSLTRPGPNAYQQLDKLVSTSANAGFEPLYCFYNFPHSTGHFNGPNSCKHTYRAPSFWGCSLAFPNEVKKAQSTQLTKLRPMMHPWHMLVCESTKLDLVGAAAKFVTARGQGHHAVGPRDLPTRVVKLMELGDRRRTTDDRRYLDDAYWESDPAPDEDIAGLIVFRDVRD